MTVTASQRVKRSWQFLIAGTLAVAAIVLWKVLTPEQTYRGRSVRYWVRTACAGGQSPETLSALQALGPDAVKLLLKALVRDDSYLKNRWLQIHSRLPRGLQQVYRRPLLTGAFGTVPTWH